MRQQSETLPPLVSVRRDLGQNIFTVAFDVTEVENGYEFETAELPPGVWRRDLIISAIIRSRYNTDDMEAIHNNVLAEEMPTWKARRILAHGEQMMMVENEFLPGDTAPEHSHYHSQITYVIDGALEVTVDGETRTLHKGDSVFIKPHAVHRAVAVEDTLLIDRFAPMREDFLD